MLKTLLALMVTLIGLFFLLKMLLFEAGTGNTAGYRNYYDWALYGGLVCIAVGVAFVLHDGEDATCEPLLLEDREK